MKIEHKAKLLVFLGTFVFWVASGMMQQHVFMIKHDGWLMMYGWAVITFIIWFNDKFKQWYLQKDT